jgi:excisionase family DNA binding protein
MSKTKELPEGEYLTSAEVMDALKISRRTLERWVADDKLPATKIGGFGSRRYKSAHIDALLRGEVAA